MRRSVERLDGVSKLEFDMESGRASLFFVPGKSVSHEDIRKAIQDSGFTAVRVEIGGVVQSYTEE